MPGANPPSSNPARDSSSPAQKSAFGKKVAKYARGQAQDSKGVKDKKLNSRCNRMS
jgi:hypothetical protein